MPLSAFCFLLFLLTAYCLLPTDSYAQELHKYRGVYHVHTEFSHDSRASLQKVIHTAKKAGLDFVVVTDHNNMNAREAYRKMKTKEGDPKLFFGVEVSAPDGHVILFKVPEMPDRDQPSLKILNWAREQGGYSFLAHPVCSENPWKNWDLDTFDGMEVYNLAHEFYPANKFTFIMKRIFYPPKLFLRSFVRPRHDALARWDERLKKRRVSAIAAVDAHIHLQLPGGINFENYLLQFQSSTVYALAPELSEAAVFDALGQGKSYMAFEAFGDARLFSFTFKDGDQVSTSGDTVQLKQGQTFQIDVPEQAEIRLIQYGHIADRKYTTRLTSEVREKGAYRAEVYKGDKLWVVSNPVYVE